MLLTLGNPDILIYKCSAVIIILKVNPSYALSVKKKKTSFLNRNEIKFTKYFVGIDCEVK